MASRDGKRAKAEAASREELFKSLRNYGFDVETAQDLVDNKLPLVKEIAKGGDLEHQGNGFEPGKFPEDMNRALSQGQLDLVEFLVRPEGKQQMATSEVPSAMVIEMAITRAVNRICDPKFKGDPVEAFIEELLEAFKARDRKRVKEIIELYQSSQEKLALANTRGLSI